MMAEPGAAPDGWEDVMRGIVGFGAGASAMLALPMLALGACQGAGQPAPPPPVPLARPDTATQIVPSATMPAATAQRPVIVGGYAPADANDADVKAAEALAVAEIYKREPQRGVVESVTRELQTVAGMNYRFTIKMTGVNSYLVVVYKPLPGQGALSVTTFEKVTG
jgi:hypothetical protein